MNQQPLERYSMLLTQLLFEREAAGGELPEEEESRFVALLDEIWWQLSSSDQEQIEGALQRLSVTVGQEPELVDLAVTEGSSALPRRAA